MKGLTRMDPFKSVGRWDPFNEMREMQRDMDRLFGRFFGRDVSVPETAGWLPLVESYKKGTDLIYKCELPGVEPKEVDVTIDESGRELVIRGERKTEKDTREEDYIQHEISYGVFERRFMLPEGVKADEVKAKFTNGILEISVPVPAATSKAKKIQVETPEMIEGEKAETRKAA